MPEFGLVLVVIQYPASFIFSLCLVICYVTTYKSILDKLGKKQNRFFFLIQLLLYFLIFTELLFKLKCSLHHKMQNKFVFEFPSTLC